MELEPDLEPDDEDDEEPPDDEPLDDEEPPDEEPPDDDDELPDEELSPDLPPPPLLFSRPEISRGSRIWTLASASRSVKALKFGIERDETAEEPARARRSVNENFMARVSFEKG